MTNEELDALEKRLRMWPEPDDGDGRSAADAIVALRRELAGRNAECVSRGKMLVKTRDALINIKDGLDDQGDLVAFGSTNDADDFRETVQELDDFKWSLIMAEKNEPDLLERCRNANARADKAERELACRDALISDHLRKIMHLENRMEDEVARAEKAEATAAAHVSGFMHQCEKANQIAYERNAAQAELRELRELLRELKIYAFNGISSSSGNKLYTRINAALSRGG